MWARDHSELFMCFLPCALLISVWYCRGSGVRPGRAFKLLLQPSAPQAAIIAIDTVYPLQGFTGLQKQYREDELCKKDVCKTFQWLFYYAVSSLLVQNR